MDAAHIASAVTALLWPHLSVLSKMGAEIGVGTAHAAGSEVWKQAKALWDRLRPSIEANPPMQAAVQRGIARPDDSRIKGAFEIEIEELLAADKTLASDVLRLLQTHVPQGTIVTASGAGSVAFGGSAQGSTIVTGDGNVVGSAVQGRGNAVGANAAVKGGEHGKQEITSPSSVHIFVSSTWLDLQPEREAVEKATQSLRDTKFVGMEYFGSREDTPREVSLAEVDKADFYIGIFGARYGSGITEAEYRRARSRSLPCHIYVKDDSLIQPMQREADATKAAQLTALKTELGQAHTYSTFTTPDNLAWKVTADLSRWLADHSS